MLSSFKSNRLDALDVCENLPVLTCLCLWLFPLQLPESIVIVLTLWFFALALWLICQIKLLLPYFCFEIKNMLGSFFFFYFTVIGSPTGSNYQPLAASANTAFAITLLVWHRRLCSLSSGPWCIHWISPAAPPVLCKRSLHTAAAVTFFFTNLQLNFFMFVCRWWMWTNTNDFCVSDFSVFSAGWAVSSAVHHGRARPRTNGLRSRAASRSPGDSWHQYTGPRAQTSGHAPWATGHHQGPYVGRHRGALWHLGELLFLSCPGLFLGWNTNAKMWFFIIAQWPRSISHFRHSSSRLVSGWHGNCMMLNAWMKLEAFFAQCQCSSCVSWWYFLMLASKSLNHVFFHRGLTASQIFFGKYMFPCRPTGVLMVCGN